MKSFKEYLAEKGISQEQLAEKDGFELSGIHNDYVETMNADVDTAIEAKASKEDVAAMRAEIVEARVEQGKEITKALKEFGISITAKFKEIGSTAKKESGVTILDALKANMDNLKKLKAKDASGVFSVKVDTITSGNISGGNVPVEQRLPGFDLIPTRQIRLLDLVNRGTATSNLITWVSQANKDGSAGVTGEGLVKNQIDFDIVVNSETLKKITSFIKVSSEMLEDVDFLASEINNELTKENILALESQVYEGDGTGLNLNGIKTQAVAFVAATAPEAVQNANALDVVVTAMTQIIKADQEPATAILMNATDVLGLKNKKVGSADDRYIDRLVTAGGQLMIDGVPIIQTNLVAVDEYLVGHFPNATVWDNGSMSIEVGFDSDDFTKNLRTILAEVRVLNIIKTNKVASFIKGVFTADKAALEAL